MGTSTVFPYSMRHYEMINRKNGSHNIISNETKYINHDDVLLFAAYYVYIRDL